MSRRRGWLAAGILAVLIIAASLTLRNWITGQSSGTVTVGKPSVDIAAAQTPPVDIASAWFTARLPAGFTIKTQRQDTGSPTELYSLNAITRGTAQMELTIGYDPIPAGLSTLSGYNIRVTQPDTYTRYAVPGAPAGSVAFRDLQNPYAAAAYVVFWPHGGNSAVIALTGGMGGTLDQLNAVFEQLMKSWEWR